MPASLEGDERVEVAVGDHVDVAAASAVAAVGATKGHVFLATEADASSPAVASSNVDFGLVEEQALSPG